MGLPKSHLGDGVSRRRRNSAPAQLRLVSSGFCVALEIEVAYPDAFAFKNSPFNTFLFSEVGLELNGLALNLLSTLARLGEDPWSQALSWTRLPRPAIIDLLADRIRQMPLCPQALLDARITASRLILLLPLRSSNISRSSDDPTSGSAMPKQLRVAIFCCALAFGLAIKLILISADPGSPAVPTEQAAVTQAPSTVADTP